MALTYVNAYSVYSGNSIGSISVTAGNLIVVMYSYNDQQSPTVSDTQSNTYNAVTQQNGPSADTTTRGHMWYAIAGATGTITITATAETDNGMSVHIYSGNNTTLASVLDVYNSSAETTAGTSHTSASITTTNAADVLVCFWFQETTGTTLTENGTSFTKRTEQSSHVHASFDRIVSSTGTYSNSVTSADSVRYANIIASFKEASGGASTAWLKSNYWWDSL